MSRPISIESMSTTSSPSLTASSRQDKACSTHITTHPSTLVVHRHPKRTPSSTNPITKPDLTNHHFYDCNICFDTAIYPVLTVCGHLFCWVCLCRWLEQQQANPTCPMCKAGCSKANIIPVYGRGYEEADPRCDESVPVRPAGQRPPPIHNPNVAGSSLLQSFRSSHSISSSTPSRAYDGASGFLSRLMLMILSLFIVIVVFY
ncbi:hypothetical protein DM01DRAFT_324924 [Hesseltinella vesiculosa]|uniref:RING-type E3 ubiquitin transferase n=1 Tax=Hesseltinella vesiculosa TaxID=101127 RepID=A0A1X2GFI2_9FUNG|nr:hypothetical protein DM01DRAFT_324924 [Hesseltinella vesiculosa]